MSGSGIAGLLDHDIELHGRIAEASNGTFLASVGEDLVVYKPIRGERPLWDFPGAVLADRERAAFLVSEALGWGVVPPTVLRGGPHGPGMVQLWCEPDESVHPVDICPAGAVPPGYLHVFDGVGADDAPVQLVHEDSEPLLRMAVFDVLVNNADRKGGHVLAMPDGRRLGVDHGITFHTEPKLRTVLWGWAGSAVPRVLLDDVAALPGRLPDEIEDVLRLDEIAALRARIDELLDTGLMPLPSREWPAVPWPPF